MNSITKIYKVKFSKKYYTGIEYVTYSAEVDLDKGIVCIKDYKTNSAHLDYMYKKYYHKSILADTLLNLNLQINETESTFVDLCDDPYADLDITCVS